MPTRNRNNKQNYYITEEHLQATIISSSFQFHSSAVLPIPKIPRRYIRQKKTAKKKQYKDTHLHEHSLFQFALSFDLTIFAIER